MAIKVLRCQLAGDASSLRRFRQELQVLARLEHANIVRVLTAGTTGDGRPYMVMDCLDGVPLSQRLARGPLSTAEFVDTFRQVACGLAFAHGNGILHRDVKPSNIFLCADGSVKLVDFGIAGWLDAGAVSDQKLTMTGAVVGTPRYMSPEQCQKSPLDERTDIFSLGCVMYEALSGQDPYPSASSLESMSMRLTEQARPLPAALPSGLRRIVMKALSRHAEDRFASARELAVSLSACDGTHRWRLSGDTLRLPDWVSERVTWTAISALTVVVGCFAAMHAITGSGPAKQDKAMALSNRTWDRWLRSNEKWNASLMEPLFKEYNRALELDPASAVTWRRKGMLLHESSWSDAALPCLEQAVALEPGDAASNYQLANAYVERRQWLKAMPFIDRAIASKPHDREIQGLRARALLGLGRYDEALKAASRFAVGQRANLESYRCLSDVYLHKKDYKTALNYCDEGLDYNGTFSVLYVMKSRIYCAMHDYAKARVFANLALGRCKWSKETLVNPYGRHWNMMVSLQCALICLHLGPAYRDEAHYCMRLVRKAKSPLSVGETEGLAEVGFPEAEAVYKQSCSNKEI